MNKEGCFGVLQAMPCLPEGQGRASQNPWETPTSRHSTNEMGMHKYGHHHSLTKSSRKF